jgi:hypothetical protein
MPRQSITNCKHVLGLSPQAYNIVRGVMKSFIKTRHQYSAEYPGFWQLLDDVVLRHTQASIQLRHIHDDWRRQATTVRGKAVYGCIKFVAEDVCAKERQYCRKNNLTWPPMTVAQSHRYLTANVGAVALEADDETTSGPATTQGSATVSPPPPAAAVPAIAVSLVIVDPNTVPRVNESEPAGWSWDDAAVRRLTIGLRSRNLASILTQIDPSLPKGREVRELYGLVRELPAGERPKEAPTADLMFLDDDALVEAFFNTARYTLPVIMVVLKRTTEPSRASPGPSVRFYEAVDKEILPEYLVEAASDSEDERIPRRFVPPQKAPGYIRRLEREHRAVQRHMAVCQKLEQCAKKWKCVDDIVFPHELWWRSGMTVEGHRTLKRKYVEMGRNNAKMHLYVMKCLENRRPIVGVHVDSEGNKVGEPDWEDLHRTLAGRENDGLGPLNVDAPQPSNVDASGPSKRSRRSQSRALRSQSRALRGENGKEKEKEQSDDQGHGDDDQDREGGVGAPEMPVEGSAGGQ